MTHGYIFVKLKIYACTRIGFKGHPTGHTEKQSCLPPTKIYEAHFNISVCRQFSPPQAKRTLMVIFAWILKRVNEWKEEMETRGVSNRRRGEAGVEEKEKRYMREERELKQGEGETKVEF